MLGDILPGTIFGFMLVFARVGAIIMVMPGFGEPFVSPRVRLGIAVAVTVVLQPVVVDAYQQIIRMPI